MPKDHMEGLYNSKNPLVRFVHRSKLKKIIRIIKFEQAKLRDTARLLDAGCGEGHLLAEIHKIRPDFKLSGIDLTQVAVEKARERNPAATIVNDDILNLSKHFQEKHFDIIICSEVLEHIPQYEKAIYEMQKCLKAGGLLIVTFPNETLLTFCRFLLGRRPIKVPDHVNDLDYFKMLGAVKNGNLNYYENYPFNWPFRLSIGTIMKFIKWVE